MPRRETAADQLARILQLLPLAARRQGVTRDELARELDLDTDQLLRDLETVASRADHHVAGAGEDTQIVLEADRVHVFTKGEFQRPARLSPAESLALGLGLRVLAAERPDDAARILELAGRLERGLAGDGAVPWQERLGVADGPGSGAVRVALLEAARERRRCEILYLKPGDPEPDRREMEPYVAVVAGDLWYVLGRCLRSDEVRAFRLDRVVGATPGEAGFHVPEDFDPERWVRDGRVFHSAGETEALVRYSPRIARWIREAWPADEQPDGGVTVRHRVADRRWLVGHVLQYGPDAEVVEPATFREEVRTALERVRDPDDPVPPSRRGAGRPNVPVTGA